MSNSNKQMTERQRNSMQKHHELEQKNQQKKWKKLLTEKNTNDTLNLQSNKKIVE